MKKLTLGLDALDKVVKGARTLCDAVKITIGPKGKNVAIDRKYTYPLITNDGVTIAKELELADQFENVGASAIKQACIKTNEMAGDGTTTACVLATSILTNGYKNITSGANAVILKKGIVKASDVVTKHLQTISKQISSKDDIFNIASISAGSNDIGKIIAQAFELVGTDGVITVDEGKTFKTELNVIQGMQFDKGYISPYMVTDTTKMQCNLTYPLIMVTDQKITNINQIIHILEQVNSSGKSLLIIADDYDNEVINTLVINKLRGNLNVVCVKNPAFADKRQALLMDICTIVGAKLISQNVGLNLNECTLDCLGEASNVIVTHSSTIIKGGKGSKQDIDTRISQIKAQIDECDNDFDKTQLQTRVARLSTGVAQILVGSNTELEMQELKLRIEDAIEATKSAIKGGIVAGGGVALVSALPKLKELIASLDGDEKVGAKTLYDAICEPIKQIALNAGVSPDVVLNKVLELQKDNIQMGYDAYSDKYVDMISSGIVDPTIVTVSALNNAVSVSATLLTTECIITADDK